MLAKLKSKLAAANAVIVGGAHRWAITRVAAANRPWLTAKLVRLMLRRVYTPGAKANAVAFDGDRACRVVLLWRPGFNEDAMEALKAFAQVQSFRLSRGALKAMAAAFIPNDVDDNNYASASPVARAGMERYRAFLKRFWAALDPKREIDAVVTANFGYYAEQEFAAALEELGVPFIALHKENSWTSGGQVFWERVYRERRSPFRGRRILVYNEIERSMQVSSGIVDPGRIEVVGMPRLDAVHRWRAANIGYQPGPCVLFASFQPTVGLPLLPRKGADRGGQPYFEVFDEQAREMSVACLCAKTHRAIVDLARAYPAITVWVKTKGRAIDRSQLFDLLGIADARDLPSNLEIIHGGSPEELLHRAAVLCGFHTTMMLEAIAAGRPVVVPWFAEALVPDVGRYLFDLEPAVTRAGSPDDLVVKLGDLALAATPVPEMLSADSRKILRQWLGNDDGRSGERAAAAILRIAEHHR